ncbi:hypothetical protein GCM10025865_18680 [Paraoerskovia sediminicola]|uniref:DUF2516 family protein n=1 Tax=Paraoerskovia sediminicola TaxID=1138587 RepID=A0ABM8G3G8_9CELL|nr:DUF2516 family protein [Paraoerskovia sediminicola]BDZ42569.1 hypothetical protein GCM10025865_18680 [Paraoerskovia sediminicola]
MFSSLQSLVLLALSVLVFAVQAYALIDCIRRPAHAFQAEGKLSKNIWLLILGVATALGFVGIGGGLGFFGLIAVVAAIVYLVDVRPKVSRYSPRRGPGSGPSGGRPGGGDGVCRPVGAPGRGASRDDRRRRRGPARRGGAGRPRRVHAPRSPRRPGR